MEIPYGSEFNLVRALELCPPISGLRSPYMAPRPCQVRNKHAKNNIRSQAGRPGELEYLAIAQSDCQACRSLALRPQTAVQAYRASSIPANRRAPSGATVPPIPWRCAQE